MQLHALHRGITLKLLILKISKLKGFVAVVGHLSLMELRLYIIWQMKLALTFRSKEFRVYVLCTELANIKAK